MLTIHLSDPPGPVPAVVLLIGQFNRIEGGAADTAAVTASAASGRRRRRWALAWHPAGWRHPGTGPRHLPRP